MESLLRDRLSLAAVLGAGIVIGVSGLYMYLKVNRGMTKELSHLTRTIESLRKDINELKAVAPTPKKCQSSVSTSSAAAATNSAAGSRSNDQQQNVWHRQNTTTSNDENEEYFDVSEEGGGDGGDSNVEWSTVDDDDVNRAPLVLEATQPNSASFFAEIDRLLSGDCAEQQMAYDKLKSRKDDNVTDPEFIWRLVRACYVCCLTAGRTGDIEQQKCLIFDGIKYANLGLAVDDDNADLHKWYAVMLGKSTDFVSIQDKIKNGYLFKEHLDAAIKLRPDDSMLYFMKGRWCYEVSMLSWVERKVASTLFASPPSSTVEEARRQFMEVERLKPAAWKENMLYIAKCLISEGNYAAAIDWLDRAVGVECTSAEEEAVHSEVLQLVAKYKGYRSSSS